ncbi:hypothetical protein TNCV_315231 [Trichonephila clavipes]|nr:hypothetical protein TNCV_315231 [Trichonephila clavipes]
MDGASAVCQNPNTVLTTVERTIESTTNSKELRFKDGAVLQSFNKFMGCGSPVIKVSDHGRHAISSIPAPLKTRRVGQRYMLNLSRAETRPPVGVVWRSANIPNRISSSANKRIFLKKKEMMFCSFPSKEVCSSNAARLASVGNHMPRMISLYRRCKKCSRWSQEKRTHCAECDVPLCRGCQSGGRWTTSGENIVGPQENVDYTHLSC